MVELEWAEGFQDDRGVVLAAVAQTGAALVYADPALRTDREIIAAMR